MRQKIREDPEFRRRILEYRRNYQRKRAKEEKERNKEIIKKLREKSRRTRLEFKQFFSNYKRKTVEDSSM